MCRNELVFAIVVSFFVYLQFISLFEVLFIVQSVWFYDKTAGSEKNTPKRILNNLYLGFGFLLL